MEGQYAPADPPGTFFSALRESLRHIHECRENPAVTKEDALEQMESRLSRMLTKMLSTPTATSFCIFRHDAASPGV